MKRFWQGFGAALLLVVLAVFLVYPQYSDYRSRAETSEMLNLLRELQRKIEDKAVQSGDLAGVGHGISSSVPQGSSLREVLVAPGGVILAKGEKGGQILVLLPSFSQGQVTWRCLGGRDEDVPASCR